MPTDFSYRHATALAFVERLHELAPRSASLDGQRVEHEPVPRSVR
jgi:hypothetical protein